MAKTKAAPKRPTKSKGDAAAWAAVGYLAGKKGNRAALALGETPVELKITGKVNGAKIDPLAVKGLLRLGDDEPNTGTSAPDAATLLAFILERVPKSRRAAALKEISEHHAKAGTLPEVDKELKGDASAMLKTVRIQKRGTKKGALTFAPATK